MHKIPIYRIFCLLRGGNKTRIMDQEGLHGGQLPCKLCPECAWTCVRAFAFKMQLYEQRTKFRLGGPEGGIHRVLRGDLLRDILHIWSRPHIGSLKRL